MLLFSFLAYLWFHVKNSNFFLASKNNLCPKKTSSKQNHINRVRIAYFPPKEKLPLIKFLLFFFVISLFRYHILYKSLYI